MSTFSIMFLLIAATIFVASTVNLIDELLLTFPIKEVEDGSRLYIRKDLENGRIY